MKVFVIIPCYNEEGSIKRVLEEIEEASKNSQYILHPVVVDDCSVDNTSLEAAKVSGVKVLNLSVNLGVGGAVQTGFIYCNRQNSDYVIKLDGDGQHNPSDIENLLRPLYENKADIVIGSRFQVYFY